MIVFTTDRPKLNQRFLVIISAWRNALSHGRESGFWMSDVERVFG